MVAVMVCMAFMMMILVMIAMVMLLVMTMTRLFELIYVSFVQREKTIYTRPTCNQAMSFSFRYRRPKSEKRSQVS